jgi:uncharacterized tellurite resistance protein B-like protein
MAAKHFSLVRRLLGGRGKVEDLDALFREALLMTLARATHADSFTSPAEVETVREVYKRHTGVDVSAADVRVAAASDLFEAASLEKWLGSVARRLDQTRCRALARALIEVIRTDGQVRSGEADFFDMVADALGLRPIDIVEIAR